MNPVIKLYIKISQYLARGLDEVPVTEVPDLILLALKGGSVLLDRHLEIDSFVNRLLKAKLMNDGKIPEERGEECNWLTLSDHLAVSALRDLSPLKNPLAMEVFWDISDQTGCGDDLICFASRIKERGDGSAIITLHVNYPDKLCEALECSREDLINGTNTWF